MKTLVIVDLQNDFLPGGSLGVKGGNEIVPIINALMPKFDLVVATLDWHPPDHMSFASNHPGNKAGDVVKVKGVEQILWPDHCIQGTHGAEIVSTLNRDKIAEFFYKGTDKYINSFSAFYDNARRQSTGLEAFLKRKHIHEIYLVGLATDYCVLYSALDARDLGFAVNVIVDACRPINLQPHDEELSFAAMAARGGKLIRSNEI